MLSPAQTTSAERRAVWNEGLPLSATYRTEAMIVPRLDRFRSVKEIVSWRGRTVNQAGSDSKLDTSAPVYPITLHDTTPATQSRSHPRKWLHPLLFLGAGLLVLLASKG